MKRDSYSCSLTGMKKPCSLFNRLLELKPDNDKAWNIKTSILCRHGQHEKAIADSEKALSVNPKLASAWYAKGSVLAELGRYEEARKYL